LRGKKKTIRARREYDAAKSTERTTASFRRRPRAHLERSKEEEARIKKGRGFPPSTRKKKPGWGLTVRSRLLDPPKKIQFLRPLCLSLSERVETMKRTFGERRARARGEVSHDPLSLFFFYLSVCARAFAS